MADFVAGNSFAEKQEMLSAWADFVIKRRDSARFIRTSAKNGQRICIKYSFGQKIGLKYRLSKIIPAFMARPYIRPLPPLPAEEKNLLEIAKLRAFRAVGLPVPNILAVQNDFSVFTYIGKNIEEILEELQPRGANLYDGLLIRCGQALGQVHAAGLCQGQPDLRNMFLATQGIGFLGFCDYPEKFMSMAAAQVRDIWLLLRLIADKAIDKDQAISAAFMAWRRQVSLETLEGLQASVRFGRLASKPYEIFSLPFSSTTRQARLQVLRFLVANVGV